MVAKGVITSRFVGPFEIKTEANSKYRPNAYISRAGEAKIVFKNVSVSMYHFFYAGQDTYDQNVSVDDKGVPTAKNGYKLGVDPRTKSRNCLKVRCESKTFNQKGYPTGDCKYCKEMNEYKTIEKSSWQTINDRTISGTQKLLDNADPDDPMRASFAKTIKDAMEAKPDLQMFRTFFEAQVSGIIFDESNQPIAVNFGFMKDHQLRAIVAGTSDLAQPMMDKGFLTLITTGVLDGRSYKIKVMAEPPKKPGDKPTMRAFVVEESPKIDGVDIVKLLTQLFPAHDDSGSGPGSYQRGAKNMKWIDYPSNAKFVLREFGPGGDTRGVVTSAPIPKGMSLQAFIEENLNALESLAMNSVPRRSALLSFIPAIRKDKYVMITKLAENFVVNIDPIDPRAKGRNDVDRVLEIPYLLD